jgi:hypothetical protein
MFQDSGKLALGGEMHIKNARMLVGSSHEPRRVKETSEGSQDSMSCSGGGDGDLFY